MASLRMYMVTSCKKLEKDSDTQYIGFVTREDAFKCDSPLASLTETRKKRAAPLGAASRFMERSIMPCRRSPEH